MTKRRPLKKDILYKAKSIADYMGCSERYVRQLRATSNAPIFFVIGSTLCSTRTLVDGFVRARQTGQPFVPPSVDYEDFDDDDDDEGSE